MANFYPKQLKQFPVELLLDSISDLVLLVQFTSEQLVEIQYANPAFLKAFNLEHNSFPTQLDEVLSQQVYAHIFEKINNYQSKNSSNTSKTEHSYLDEQKQNWLKLNQLEEVDSSTYLLISNSFTAQESSVSKTALARVMEQSLDVICTIDKNACFVDVSSAAKTVWGYTPEELAGKPYMDFVVEEDCKKTQQSADEIIGGKKVTNFKNRYRKKDGSIITLIWSAQWDEQHQMMYCVARDATEMLAAREKALHNAQLMREAQRLAKTGSWDYDFKNDKLTWTDGVYDVFGVNKNEFELNLENFIKLVHPDDRKQLEKNSDKVKNEGTPATVEYRVVLSNGENRFVEEKIYAQKDDSGTINRLFGTVQNITEAKKEQQIKQIEYRFLKQALNESIEIKPLIKSFLNEVEHHFEQLKITILKVESNKLYSYLAPSLPETFLSAFDGVSIGPEKGACGAAAFTKKKVITEDIATHKNWKEFKTIPLQFGLKSCWSQPIFDSKGEVIAVLGNYKLCDKKPADYEVESFNRLASLLGIVIDNKVKRDEIQKVNERYKTVSNVTSDAVWDFNLKSKKLYWGEGFDKLFGLKTEWNKDNFAIWQKRLHPEDKERVTNDFKEMIAGDINNWKAEYRFQKSNGKYAYILDKALILRNEEGEATRAVGALQDISAKKEEKQRLQLMESVIKNTNDGILITKAHPISNDGPEIIFANQAFLKMTGYSLEEVVGKTPRIFQGPRSDRKALNELKIALEKEQPKETTTVNYTKTNQPYWVNFNVSPIKNESGKVTHFIAVERDITEQKNQALEKELIANTTCIFNNNENLIKSLDQFLPYIARFGDYDTAEIWSSDTFDHSLKMLSKFATTNAGKNFYRESRATDVFAYGEGIPGTVWKSKQFQLWENVDNDKKFIRYQSAKVSGMKHFLALPLFHQSELTAVLVLGTQKGKEQLDFYLPILNELQEFFGAELHRKRLQDELNNLFQSAPDIICVTDFYGVFRKINPAVKDVLGYSAEELIGKKFYEFVHAEDVKKTQKEVEVLNRNFPSYSFQNRYVSKSGELKWLSWTATPSPDEGLIFAVAKDITEYKITEKKLKETNDRFLKVAQATNDAIWDFNLETEELFWGEGFYTLFGHRPSDFDSIQDWIIRVHPEDYDRVNESFQSALSEKNIQKWEETYRFKKADGDYAHVIDRGLIVRNEHKKPTRMVGSVIDITYQKKHEKALLELNHQLKKHTKDLELSNAELEQFAYVASHDLQEPLRMITSFLSLLQKRYEEDLDEKAHQYIHFAVDGATRMRQIILDLLEYSRVGRKDTEKASVDLNELITDYRLLRKKKMEEIQATIETFDLPTIKNSPAALTQIFHNIIDNSLKYSRKNVATKVVVTAKDKEKYWEFSISDNGIGIEEEYFEKIFVIFQRLHGREEYDGTGMGLAIVKKNIDSLNGKIWVESTIDNGSTFYFTIPKEK
ncbi:MAG: PAS domain-containing protein [Bacteroidota bacterium]